MRTELLNNIAHITRRIAPLLPTYGAVTLARLLPRMPREFGVIQTHGGDFIALCGDRPDIISQCLYWFGRFDPWVTAVARQAVAPSCQALDIGANLGAVTIPLAQAVGPRGKVWSFEPDEVNYVRLSANVTANSSLNIEAIRCAISTARFVRIISLDGDPGHISTTPSSENAPCVVPARTLDSICSQVNSETGLPVTLCKIDVEGSELDVLLSGEAALASGVIEAILFECHETVKNGQPVADVLLNSGYRIFRIHKFAYGTRLVPMGSTSRIGIATHDYVACISSSATAGRLRSLMHE